MVATAWTQRSSYQGVMLAAQRGCALGKHHPEKGAGSLASLGMLGMTFRNWWDHGTPKALYGFWLGVENNESHCAQMFLGRPMTTRGQKEMEQWNQVPFLVRSVFSTFGIL